MRHNNCFMPVVCLLALLPLCNGQTPKPAAMTGARSANAENAESTARDLFVNGDYDKAVPILERAVEKDPKDMRLLNVLGMAYLYSASRIDTRTNYTHVQPTMEKVIDGGGTATFLVGRAMDNKLVKSTKTVLKAVSGELAISKDSFTFTPTHGGGDSIGPVSKDDVKECGLNKNYGKDSNTFHIKTSSNGELDFRPLHFSKEEALAVCKLAAKYWAIKFDE